MARRSKHFDEDVKRLIQCFAEFDSDDENFQLCRQFTLSNFKYHKFLDVDSHKVTRTINGVHEKFLIHSQPEKAEHFTRLVEKFLDSPIFENRDHGKTDTHYAILSMLLCVAGNPTEHDYVPSEKVKREVEEKSFDWASYLKEGVEIHHPTFDSSPISSEDESSEDEGIHVRHVRIQAPRIRQVPHLSEEVEVTVAPDIYDDQQPSWLDENVISQYWRGRQNEDHVTDHRSSILTFNWQDHLASISPLLVAVGSDTVTEYQVTREVLWALLGCSVTHVFCIDGSTYTVNPSLQLSHATQETLGSLLRHICTYANIILTLRCFIDEVAMVTITSIQQSSETSASSSSQTFQAVADAISQYLHHFHKELVELEKLTLQQDVSLTLSQLVDELRPRFHELDVLSHVYHQGIAPYINEKNQAHRASLFLGVLYDTLIQEDLLGELSRNIVSFLLHIWVKSSKPYWDITDEWLHCGILNDPQNEFLIQRNPKVKSLDESFWDTAYTVVWDTTSQEQNGPPDLPSQTLSQISSQTSSTLSQTSSHFSHTSSQNTSTIDSDFAQVTIVPSFLTPVLRQIVMAGKSMEMLTLIAQRNGHKKVSVDHSLSLYKTFISQLVAHLQDSSSSSDSSTRTTTVSAINSANRSSGTAIFAKYLEQQMEYKGPKSQLLLKNFSSIFNPHRFHSDPLNESEQDIQKKLSKLNLDNLTPIQVALQTCLYPHIIARYREVCTTLLAHLTEDYHMMKHFAIMRKFFLLEAGDIMYDFYTDIFEKLRLNEPWQDISFLNSGLQSALQVQDPQLADRLFVSIEETAGKRDRQPITALDGLELHYKVDWPMDVILNSKCMNIYNQIFHFLLQIKRAKHGLDGLRFTDLTAADINVEPATVEESYLDYEQAPSRKQQLHQLHLFRMKLMHFVNTLHNYVLTRILHSTGLEFQEQVSKAEDLDSVITVHNNYLSTIHERCLLHRKVSVLKEAIVKVLNLSIIFQRKWDMGIDKISVKMVKDMEAEFSHWVQFLSSILLGIIKRGSFPHLEALAFALVSTSGPDAVKSK